MLPSILLEANAGRQTQVKCGHVPTIVQRCPVTLQLMNENKNPCEARCASFQVSPELKCENSGILRTNLFVFMMTDEAGPHLSL